MSRRKIGRPSKYEERFCQMVEDHMAGGASLTSFAAEIGVARSTLNEWMGDHAAFSDACARAKAKCAAWWEKTARQITIDGKGSAQLAIFGMKNMGAEDWRDKQEIEHSGGVTATMGRLDDQL